MSVHALNHQTTFLTPRTPATPLTAKPGSSSSFGQLLGSVIPNTGTSNQGTSSSNPAPATGFAALFSNYNPPVTKTASGSGSGSGGTTTTGTTPPPPFTASYEQGAYVSNPDGTETAMNPLELATQPTADEVAQLLGGTVVNSSLSGSYNSSVPTREISVPGSNVQVNAGLAAGLFATYGTAPGSQAWQIINRDLGLTLPGSTGTVS